jgi:5'-nucleotidase
MRILLTNDDGIDAAGLRALKEALSPDHELWIVAPESERSGSSHAITFRDSIRVRELGERLYSCRGTPADCVMLSLLGLVPKGVDLVISGINHGPNLGTDILYSGTAAAACQAVLMGVPAIALSIGAYVPPFDFGCAVGFTIANLEIFRGLSDPDHYLNINFPNAERADGEPRITFPSRRIYRDELETYTAPNRDVFCFMDGAPPYSHLEEGSDFVVLSKGHISISPIGVHPVNCGAVEGRYRGVKFT